VILFILLSGEPPFYGEKDEEVSRKILKCEYNFDNPIWETISHGAIDLIKLLLCKNYKKRLSAEQALQHVWIKNLGNNEQLQKHPTLKEEDQILSKNVFHNMQNFRNDCKLQQAALSYIIHNISIKEDHQQLRNLFKMLDENGDGRLSREELIKGMSEILPPTQAKAEVDKMMAEIDVDNNGFVEYEEFLKCSINKDMLLSEENLKMAFNLFDKDRSGKISANEIKQVLGHAASNKGIPDVFWKQVLGEIDDNNDGEVSYSEFKKMMFANRKFETEVD
jgi:calcium-dependent protein kinase